jgi:hypothetical protein
MSATMFAGAQREALAGIQKSLATTMRPGRHFP